MNKEIEEKLLSYGIDYSTIDDSKERENPYLVQIGLLIRQGKEISKELEEKAKKFK